MKFALTGGLSKAPVPMRRMMAFFVLAAAIMMLLMMPGRTHANSGVTITNIQLTPAGGPIKPGGTNGWEINFTTPSTLDPTDTITIDFGPRFKLNITNMNLVSGTFETRAVWVNGSYSPSNVSSDGGKITFPVTTSIRAGGNVKVTLETGAITNDFEGGGKDIQVSTSIDPNPSTYSISIDNNVVQVTLDNTTQGAARVKYSVHYAADHLVSGGNNLALLPSRDITFSLNKNDYSVNGFTPDFVGYDGYLYISLPNTLQATNTIDLEMIVARNPMEPGDYPFAVSSSGYESQMNFAPVTITGDTTPPIGSIALESGESFTYSKLVRLRLNASDGSGSGVSSYALSTTGDFSGNPPKKPFGSVVPFLIADNTKNQRVYVQYYDGAGNASEISWVDFEYRGDALNLLSLTTSSGAAEFPVSPNIDGDEPSYQVKISKETTTVTLTPVLKYPSGKSVSAAQGTLALPVVSGQITVSGLKPGANPVRLTVTPDDHSGYKTYNLVLFREAPALDAEPGQIFSLGGGTEWMVADKDQRTLVSVDAITACPWMEGSNFFGCSWEKNRTTWNENELGYRFQTDLPGTVPYYLNHDYTDSLGTEKSQISDYPYDNTVYENTVDAPQNYAPSVTRSVMAKVGLLSRKEYTDLQSNINLQIRERYNNAWLINPQHDVTGSGPSYRVLATDFSGSPVDDFNSNYGEYKLVPVIHLFAGAKVKSGSGTFGDPYLLDVSDSTIVNLTYGNQTYTPNTERTFNINVAAGVDQIALQANSALSGTTISSVTGGAQLIGEDTIQFPHLEPGNNTAVFQSQSPDGTQTSTYTIIVNKKSVPTVSSVVYGNNSYMPDENKRISIGVNSVTSNVYLYVNTTDSGARIMITNSTVSGAVYGLGSDGVSWINLPGLSFGDNQIQFQLVSSDGLQGQSYTIVVNRAPVGSSAIQSVIVGERAYVPDGGPIRINLDGGVSLVQLSVITSDPKATMTVTGSTVTGYTYSSLPGGVNLINLPNLVLGENRVQVQVASYDQTQTSNYEIVLIRGVAVSSVEAALNNIRNRVDANGDGKFYRADVVEWLKRIPPRKVTPIGTMQALIG
ncbi:hypothetical protein O9H85_13755 [Paenibacillus filicis]|uniref:Cadherin-like beta sandwich domain-containing protein n=1 Tax=Paenibacillus gyeongsangnamensis TaxID=3388067 RepID=A0ABT4Q9C5_9BACL|nr:hypothetical protein [Paenibacillus filicis]MCZ8513477.1 hypothetical protein [Paenibacillus filicis]